MNKVEERFIDEMSRTFKRNKFKIIKIPFTRPKHKESMYANYAASESLAVDGEQLRISWLPYIKDMSEEDYKHIFDRVREAVKEILHMRKQRNKAGVALKAYKNAP